MKNDFVAITDIDQAYLHALMDKFVFMVFEGEMAKMLVKVCPQYKEFENIMKDKKESSMFVSSLRYMGVSTVLCSDGRCSQSF